MPEWTITIETERLGDTAELADQLERFAEATSADFGKHGPAAAIHDGALALTLTVDAEDAGDAIAEGLHVFALGFAEAWDRPFTHDGLIRRVELEHHTEAAAA